ncbi:MAG: hypothetical protein ACYTFO_10185, partial [Planctomycetota bacterium]|jgi:hypothetical protein
LTPLQIYRDSIDDIDGLYSPRYATISPDGLHLYVAGYNDSTVAAFGHTFNALPFYVNLLADDVVTGFDFGNTPTG